MTRLALLVSLILLAAAPGAGALLHPQLPFQDGEAVADAAAAPAPLVAAERNSAQATFLTFLSAMNDVADGNQARLVDAVACLDLSDVNEIIREERGPELAIDLKEVVDHLKRVNTFLLPTDPDATPYVFHAQTEGRVVLSRVASGEWLFSVETVAAIPTLLSAVENLARVAGKAIEHPLLSSKWIRGQVSDSLTQVGFLLEHWQWLGLLLLAFAGVLVDRLLILFLAFVTSAFLKREHLAIQGATIRSGLRPFGLLAMALVWQWGLRRLGLPDETYVFLKVAAEFIVALAGVWGAYRLVDILGEALRQWADTTESALDDLLVPLAVKSLKVFVFALGIVFLAHQLRFNVLGLATGLGLGGLAFALAAQDLVKNLFGSVMVIADRTFQAGDWVVIGDVEGTVERVGFRSTRIRTFYNSLITMPNSALITASVDNFGSRRYRRWKTHIAVTYDTPPESIEAFCEGIRELVRRHPYTRKDYYHVYLTAFGPASLDVLIYIFFECPDWSTELRERQRLMLDIMRLAGRMGVEFAFPTQTLHVRQEGGTPPGPIDFGSQRDVSQASMKGRKEAREILSAFGLDGDKPPPVRIEGPTDENRGEAGDG
jgi:MscS family membrane protein